MSGEPGSLVRHAADQAAVNEWALVLAAAGIPHRIARGADGWTLLVAPDDGAAAHAALDDYDRERVSRAAEPDGTPDGTGTSAGIVVAALLVGLYLVTGGRADGGRWLAAGQAVAERIFHGEWWRAVTALTLHADAAHLAGNVAASAVFVTAVCRALGVGVGAWLVLAAGAAGNALAALLRPPGAASIGASTAVFGAVGILGALAWARRRRAAAPPRRAWVPVAATLALLGLLGTGERADLAAHLCGLLAGLVAGGAAAALPSLPGAAVQRMLALGAVAAVAAAWGVALWR